jgi:NADPH:quinone reductase-like Zn-dependent oxidoreductase
MIGVLTGVSGTVSTAAILRRHLRVHGIYVGSREMFEEMNRAIAVGSMRPPIDRSFDFEDARDAYEHLLGASHAGKVTIRL